MRLGTQRGLSRRSPEECGNDAVLVRIDRGAEVEVSRRLITSRFSPTLVASFLERHLQQRIDTDKCESMKK